MSKTTEQNRVDVHINTLLTLTEVGMLGYWVFATLAVLQMIVVPPEWMYSDYKNPLIVSWNWSFFPLDVLFAVTGLTARFAPLAPNIKEHLKTFSLSLMFCAGLMAISFWTIQQSFDPFWWGINIWLVVLPMCVMTYTWACTSKQQSSLSSEP